MKNILITFLYKLWYVHQIYIVCEVINEPKLAYIEIWARLVLNEHRPYRVAVPVAYRASQFSMNKR